MPQRLIKAQLGKKNSIEQTDRFHHLISSQSSEKRLYSLERESSSLGWKGTKSSTVFFLPLVFFFFFFWQRMSNHHSREQVTEFLILKAISWLRSDGLMLMNTFSFLFFYFYLLIFKTWPWEHPTKTLISRITSLPFKVKTLNIFGLEHVF